MAGVFWGALLIFVVRVTSTTSSTFRTLMMMQGRKFISAVLSFMEALLFAVAFGAVAQNLSNVWNLLAYALGYAVGVYVGLIVEGRIALGLSIVTIISQNHAREIAARVRKAGGGATEEGGWGRQGEVGIVRAVVRRAEVRKVLDIAHQIDPEAFITIEAVQGIRQGYFRMGRS